MARNTQSLAAAVLAEDGDLAVVEAILSYLDWKSLLAVSEVCKRLNDCISESSRLQLVLRRAYYGCSTRHSQFDRGVFQKYADNKARLSRMIDVRTGWREGKPATVHQLSFDGRGSFAASDGLVVGYGDHELPTSTAIWNHDRDVVSGDDGDVVEVESWRVWDTYHLRDATHPQASVPKWTMQVDHPIHSLDISRQDNMVAVATLETQFLPDNTTVGKLKVRFYILEPTREHTWKEGAVLKAIPHPDATPITITPKPALDLSPDGLAWAVRDLIKVKLGSGGRVMISPSTDVGWKCSQFYWKTGVKILLSSWKYKYEKKQLFFYEEAVSWWEYQNDMCTIGEHGSLVANCHVNNQHTGTRADIEAELFHANLPQTPHHRDAPTDDYKPSVSHYAAMDPVFTLAVRGIPRGPDKVELSSDFAGNTAAFTIMSGREDVGTFCYIAAVRFDRLLCQRRGVAQQSHKPLYDWQCLPNHAITAISGYRTIVFEQVPNHRGGTSAAPDEYRLHVSDLAANTPDADIVHAAPLGYRQASPPPHALPTTPQEIQHHTKAEAGKSIAFDRSDAWDSSDAPNSIFATDFDADEGNFDALLSNKDRKYSGISRLNEEFSTSRGTSGGTTSQVGASPETERGVTGRCKRAFGCPRSTVLLALDIGYVRWMKADTDHLYIAHDKFILGAPAEDTEEENTQQITNLTILSF